MKRIICLFIITLLLASPSNAQSTEDLFQQALRVERSSGNYEAAIALYEQVAAAPGAERRLTAKALIQIGLAYENLGRSEAEDAYSRVISEFADLSDLAAEAQAGVQRLNVPAGEIDRYGGLELSEEVRSGPHYGSQLSPDGQLFLAFDGNTGQILYQGIGEDHVTYIKNEDVEEWGYNTPKISPDNTLIAYSDFHERRKNDDFGSVWIYSIDSKESRKIFSPANTYSEILDWSSDQESILISIADDEIGNRVALISTHDGSISASAEVGYSSAGKMCLLGNRYVVYNQTRDDIREVMRVDFVTGVKRSFLPQGGGELVDCSDRGKVAIVRENVFGVSKTLVYRIDANLPNGQPRVLEQSLSKVNSIGITNEGDLYYYNVGSRGVESYEYDFESGVVHDKISFQPGGGLIGWSADGKRFAHNLSGNEFLVADNNAEERVIILDDHTRNAGWTRDGEFIFSSPTNSNRESWETLWIDAATGRTVDSVSFKGYSGPEGSVLWGLERKDEEHVCIIEQDIGASQSVEVLCFDDKISDQFYRFSISPDASRALLFSIANERQAAFLTMIDLNSGESTLLPQQQGLRLVEWFPDGQSILALYTVNSSSSFIRHYLDGKKSESVFVRLADIGRVFDFRLHPKKAEMYVKYWRAVENPGMINKIDLF
jgi:hypothetical protein